MLFDSLWLPVKDGDPRALALYLRHYSARHYRDHRPRRLFVGPGEKMVLMTENCDALFVWRKSIDYSGQEGVNCSIFRNESSLLSSDLIREACHWAWRRWPGERLYTYVAPRKIRSTNPGYCFLKAGWRRCGETRKHLVILEILPGGENENRFSVEHGVPQGVGRQGLGAGRRGQPGDDDSLRQGAG